RVFNTTEQTGMFDRVIVATGTSNRQTRALASHVRDKAKAAGGHVISTEGEDTGEWVLVDLGDAVVHIMQPAIRVYYNLEELWGGKPVRIKLNENGPRGRASADPDAKRAAPRTRAKAAEEAASQASPEEAAKAPRAKAPQAQAPTATEAKKPRRPRATKPAEDAATKPSSEKETGASTARRRVARKAQAG
ncbi:MAG: ribosome silencing factor, partial [Gammaproteobacteria bacterium]